MIKKSINKEIFKIALPNILGNITVPLLGIVDTRLMGYKDKNATVLIGAIALGGVIFNAIYWNFGFLRVGTTGLTAQAYGSNDRQTQATTLFRALLLGLFIAFMVLAMKSLISNFGFSLLENEENKEAISFARNYFNVRIWALPAVMLLFGIRGWFYGMQNAYYPFILTFVVNLVNIACSVYFVRVQGMNADGVALGTVVAQYVCLIVGIGFIIGKYKWIFSYFQIKTIFIWNQLKRFFKVSTFVLGRNIMLFVVFAAFTYFSSAISHEYFAVNEMLLQLFFLMSFAVDGFAYASEALVGKYTGAKNHIKLQQTIRWTMIWGIGFGVLYAILYLAYGDIFLRLFTPDKQLIDAGKPYLFWLSIISIVGAISFIWDGIYIGSTLVVQMFMSMTMATISFFVVYFSLKTSLPRHAIWAAMSVYMLFRGGIQWLLYYQLKNRV